MKYIIISILFIPFTFLHAQNSLTDWTTINGTIEEKEHLGRKAVFLDKGLAYLNNSNFKNGIIEVDISTTIMAGLAFRIDDSLNYEEVYMRYPKSGFIDALQYSAICNGETSWQFWPEYQANVKWPSLEKWVHLKIVVKNYKAAIFVLNNESPVLLVDSLRSSNTNGKIGIWTLRGAYFSNFSYTKSLENIDTLTFKNQLSFNKNAIHKWEISKSELYKSNPPNKLDNLFFNNFIWEKVEAEQDGFLNINKFSKKNIGGQFRNNSTDIVWLKYEWAEKSNGIKPLSFEYANKCIIYHNNVKTFAGNNSFLLKGPLYRGDIDKKMRANTIFLPVIKGKNTLHIAVSSLTNGWGFMAQFIDGSILEFNPQ